MKIVKKRVVAKKATVKKKAITKPLKKLTRKEINELKKNAKSPYGWRALIGIGLVNGKRPKRDTRPDKDIIWGD